MASIYRLTFSKQVAKATFGRCFMHAAYMLLVRCAFSLPLQERAFQRYHASLGPPDDASRRLSAPPAPQKLGEGKVTNMETHMDTHTHIYIERERQAQIDRKTKLYSTFIGHRFYMYFFFGGPLCTHMTLGIYVGSIRDG